MKTAFLLLCAALSVSGVAAPDDYLVIDCRAPWRAMRYACAADLPDGGLTNRLYARERLVMRRIPAKGVRFRMGNDRAEVDALRCGPSKREEYFTNAPVREVSFARDWWMGVYPLTQRQLVLLTGQPNTSESYEVEGTKPSRTGYGEPDERPAECLSQEDLLGFPGERRGGRPSDRSVLGVIRLRTGWAFDLPAEAEWEYACRAGLRGPWNVVVRPGAAAAEFSRFGWFGWMNRAYPDGGRHWGATHPVGLLEPNAWGLYDLHGNVWEICRDAWAGKADACVVRGGAYENGPDDCRSAFRNHFPVQMRLKNTGVRLMLPDEGACR